MFDDCMDAAVDALPFHGSDLPSAALNDASWKSLWATAVAERLQAEVRSLTEGLAAANAAADEAQREAADAITRAGNVAAAPGAALVDDSAPTAAGTPATPATPAKKAAAKKTAKKAVKKAAKKAPAKKAAKKAVKKAAKKK